MTDTISFLLHKSFSHGEAIRSYFWSDWFWLPYGVTWKDMERKDEDKFIPDATDLWITVPIAVMLFLIRLIWEKSVALPIGRCYKLKEAAPVAPPYNSVLEQAYRLNGKCSPDHGKLQVLAKDADLTVREVERWWRKRRMIKKPSEMQRFKETSWRFLFYFISFWAGLYILWDKSWFADTRHCWIGFPKQYVSADVRWYFLIELSFYLSLLLSLTTDIKRKDFTEMVVHHFATITLMILSWSINMVRIGSLILCIHDAVDYLLEGGKLLKYCSYNRLSEVVFVIFTIMWFVTRLVIYPFRLLYSVFFEVTAIIGFFPIYVLFTALLIILQVLHVIWFKMILAMVYQYAVTGEITKDERSDSEDGQHDDDDDDVDNDGDVKFEGKKEKVKPVGKEYRKGEGEGGLERNGKK